MQLEFQRKNGSRVNMELLRPVEWIERNKLEAGSAIFMSNAEIEVRGTGRVLAIEDCPPLADGEGSVVISRIKTHHAGDLVELQFENGETLTGTTSHPIWSADRQDWVPMGKLHEGEYTQSRDGLLKITRRIALPDMQPVYNLEVHGEHVYEVTRAGVLVHNNVADCLRLDALRKKLAEGSKLNAEELANFNRLKEQFSKIGKTLIESPEVSKVLDKMGAGQRAQVDKILDDLAHGRPGRNQHALTGDLKGKFAVDVPGSGRGRGALRIVYEDTLDGIVLHFITDYH